MSPQGGLSWARRKHTTQWVESEDWPEPIGLTDDVEDSGAARARRQQARPHPSLAVVPVVSVRLEGISLPWNK